MKNKCPLICFCQAEGKCQMIMVITALILKRNVAYW